MKQISAQSKSFIILSTIAIVGTAFSVFWTNHYKNSYGSKDDLQVTRYPKDSQTKSSQQASVPEEKIPAVDTSTWKQYTDETYDISFKYNPAWKVQTAKTKNGWYVVQLDPGAKYDNIRVYVSDKGYFAMDGLPMEEEQLGNTKALSVVDLLYGLKNDKYYYTFDLGASISLQPQFMAMVKSVNILSN